MIGILLNSYLLKLIQIICISVRPILNSKKQKISNNNKTKPNNSPNLNNIATPSLTNRYKPTKIQSKPIKPMKMLYSSKLLSKNE